MQGSKYQDLLVSNRRADNRSRGTNVQKAKYQEVSVSSIEKLRIVLRDNFSFRK